MSTNMLRAALAFAAVVLMTVAPAMAALDGGDAARSGGSRSTAIDGQFRDNITSEQNFTLYDDAVIRNGMLTLDRTYWSDDFNRGALGPDWTIINGTVRIQGSMLRTNATLTENATVERELDLHDLEINLEVAPGRMMRGGPIISLVGANPPHVWFAYEHLGNKIRIGYNDQAGRHVSASGDVTLETDTFVLATIKINGALMSFSMGGAPIMANLPVIGNFSAVRLTSPRDESAAWENMTVMKMEAFGRAVCAPVPLPVDTYWETLGHRRADVQDGTIKTTLLNGSDSKPLEGLIDFKSTAVDLSDPAKPTFINPVLVRSVILKVELSYKGGEYVLPGVDHWYITWAGDAPRWMRAFDPITLSEDTPAHNVTDVRNYFEDRFTPRDELVYSIRESSNDLTVRPYLEGYNLSLDLPTRDWAGTASFRVRASDGTLHVDGNVIDVEVLPVDDPPVVRPIPSQTVNEDEPFELNVTDYLDDVDTPRAELTLRTLSPRVEIVDHTLRFTYDRGGFTDEVEVEVSDGTGETLFSITVLVIELDDPPAIAPIYELLVNEDEPRTMDLAPFLSDEDTPLAYLRLVVVDGGENVTIDGFIAHVNFTRGGGQFTYVLRLSDNITAVEGQFKVKAVAVNDRPRIVTVGGIAPAGGAMEVPIEELGTMRLDLVVTDEEGSAITLSLITDWTGATIDGQALVLNAPLGNLGVQSVKVIASDGSLTDGVTINVTVTNRNDPPTDVAITKPANGATFKEDESILVDGFARDADTPYGDVMTFSWYVGDILVAEGKPKTLTNLSVGAHTITLKVSDGEAEVTASINITVLKKDGGNGNGNGDGDGDGTDDGGGGKGMLYAGIGIVVVVVVVLALVLMMRGRKGASAAPAPKAAAPQPKVKKSAKGPDKAPKAAAPAAGKQASEYEGLYGKPEPAAPERGEAAADSGGEDDFKVKTYEEVVGQDKPKE